MRLSSTVVLDSIYTVPSNFSWDNAVYDTSTVVYDSTIPTTQTDITLNGLPVYVAYAPIAFVNIHSSAWFSYSLGTLVSNSNDTPYQIRAIDFGDFYNSSTNVFIITGSTLTGANVDISNANHTYVMPGLYSINISYAEYIIPQGKSIYNNIVELQTNPLLDLKGVVPNLTIDTDDGSTFYNATVQFGNTTGNFYLSVVEIPPTAYLYSDVEQHEIQSRTYPFTVKLSPRYTLTGSFPIEKISWDLGDGSPVFHKLRRDNNASLSATPSADFPYFVYSGSLPDDPNDPRNYDIVHTYNCPDVNPFNFYPSITAYASSTSTSDICSVIIGPLVQKPYTNKETPIRIIQNELKDTGSIILAQIEDNEIGVWKTD